MRATGAIVHTVTRHDFIFKTLPEVPQTLFCVLTLKDKYILNDSFFSLRVQLQLQTLGNLLLLGLPDRFLRLGV